MKIRGWHVDGFGIHRDWRVDDLSPGLSVFYGPNEAGKSTLLAFLRGVLFGYPDGRSKEAKYPPLGGGPHGGRITLGTGDGTLVVERFTGRGNQLSVTLEDGTPGDAGDLARRLGGADARLFRSVYAFGLGELQQLETLGDAGVQDHLFSAGVTGAGRSARQAVRELEESARELFAGVRARKSDRARALAEEIRGVRADLYLRQEAAEGYPEVRRRERTLDAQIHDLEAEAERHRITELRARKLIELWNDVWSPLAGLREQAAKLVPATSDELPLDARGRLESALEAIERERERLDGIRNDRKALAARLDELRLDEAARAVAPRVAALHEQLALYRSQSERLLGVQSRMAESAARISSIVARLGEGFGEAELRALQVTAIHREELRTWKLQLDAVIGLALEREAATRVAVEQRDRAEARLSSQDEGSWGPLSKREIGQASALILVAAAAAGWLTGSVGGLVLGATLAAAGALWSVTRSRRDRAEVARAHAQEELELQAAQVAAAEEGQRLGSERMASLERSFQAWKQGLGVPASLSWDATMEFLEDVRRGHEALEECEERAAERRRLERDIDAWNGGVDAVLEDSGGSLGAAGSLGARSRADALSALRERCESDRTAREGREPLERHAAQLRERFVAQETALAGARTLLAALLEEAGVEDSRELERRLRSRDAARLLDERIARFEEDLARRMGSGGPDEEADLRKRLPRGRVSDWEELADLAREKIVRVGAKRDGVLREHQDEARLCERLERSTEVMDLELRKSALEEELRQILSEWRRTRLARGLIDAALERFEARHQPGVLREASHLFEQVTGGSYPRIVQSDQERAGFSVLTDAGLHRSPNDLSRGTAEQLYLCVRLGLVAELARTRVALPVVMDDVLVNFDDERAAAMASVLGAFADAHQLLFFTCSGRTRDLLVQGREDVDRRTFE